MTTGGPPLIGVVVCTDNAARTFSHEVMLPRLREAAFGAKGSLPQAMEPGRTS